MNTDLIESLVKQANELAAKLQRLPESTYRLQFHKGFTFRDAVEIIPYLAELGITHVYASPILRAAPGSMHGYDVIDHCRLNPEFGTESDFDDLVAALSRHGITLIVDTVPNHVGVATNENSWWNDVLEHGPASRYGNFFDIAWQDSPRAELHDRILIPILGKSCARALEDGELKLTLDAAAGSFHISYYQRSFPVNPSSYNQILDRAAVEDAEWSSIRLAIEHLPNRSSRDPHQSDIRRRETTVIKRRLAELYRAQPQIKAAVQSVVDMMNGRAGDAASFDALDQLLCAQCYRLAWWRTAADEINYRRFFDINDLAAMVMEREDVFVETHALTLRLLAEGKIAGLRIDHPDGLYDPETYFDRLQSHYLLACAMHLARSDPQCRDIPAAQLRMALLPHLAQRSPRPHPLYVVAEKILAVDERLPRDWAIDGTSGYHFLNMINGLFVDRNNEEAFSQIYAYFVGDPTSFSEWVYRKKKLVLNTAMGSELQMLTHRLGRLAARHRRSRDFSHHALRDALAETIACFPVYRTYITSPRIDPVDRERIESSIASAIQRNAPADPDVFAFIRDMLLQKSPPHFTESDRAEQLAFVGKFQQLTAPVTAKGVEDTAFYIYHRLVSLNEVGGDPARFGMQPDELHPYLAARQRAWPRGLSALSTHDTKRSEDVRARINVLSELPEEWRQNLTQWQKLLGPCLLTANEQCLLFQTMLGAWPMEQDSHDLREFTQRINAYMLKAMREAKVNTSWTSPNERHEKAADECVARLLGSREFLDQFRPFQKRIAELGMINSLSQTLLRLAAPGVPDTYQGAELWDLSLVDPDNRRPVDYAHRRRIIDDLHALKSAHRDNLAALADDLWQSRADGRVKFWITWRLLRCRRDHPGLFTTGSYTPLEVTGPDAQHLFAFARHDQGKTAIVVVPRLLAWKQRDAAGRPRLRAALALPQKASRLIDIFTGRHAGDASADQLLAHLPVAVLMAEN
jgi:(1->4)-alpha-D-glucan 1-alpha-D-glucosylmutase